MNLVNPLKNIVFIACSGASYNGELSRQVAIQLSDKSSISHLSSLLCFTIFMRHSLLEEEDSLKRMKEHLSSSYIVVIDGCSGACVFKILKFLDCKPDMVINLTKLVPKKPLEFNSPTSFQNQPRLSNLMPEDFETVATYIIQQLKEKNVIREEQN